jgi:hypothetical protein
MTIYQLLPPLTGDEYAALKADIAARGVQVPIEFDEDGAPLDGHHRLRACDELGITEYPRVVRSGLSEAQKVEHVLALNLARRHLSREQQVELGVQLRRQNWSYPRIAEALGVSVDTAWRDTRHVSDIGNVTGADGKSYPAQRPTPAPFRWDSQAFEADPEPPEPTYVDPEWPEEPVVEDTPPAPKAAHVAYNSGESEWYTPPEYLDAARATMGSIDFDPASTSQANERVHAAVFCDAACDGLTQPWHGNIWLNPPYAQPLISQFASAAAEKFTAGEFAQACVLVNNATETSWFQRLLCAATAICFVRGRVRFLDPQGLPGAPLQGQIVLYLGTRAEQFAAHFADFGPVWRQA